MAVYYRADRDCWVVDVTDEWNRRHRKFLKSEPAARALESSLKSSIAQSRSQLRTGDLPDLTLSDAITIFLSTIAASATTRGHNAQRLAALTKVIGNPKLHDVTPQLLAQYQAHRVQQVSPATLSYEAQVIFRMFRTLVSNGHLATNPATLLHRKPPHFSPGRELTQEEEHKVLASATPRTRLRLLLALDAGLRRSEVMGLKRRDWQNDRLVVWRPKTRTTTVIPLTKRLLSALTEIAACLQPDSAIHSYGGVRVTTGTRFLDGLRARTLTSFRFHDLRHTFATRLRRVAPYEVVQLLLGHTFKTTTERYIHPSFEDCSKAMQMMEKGNTP